MPTSYSNLTAQAISWGLISMGAGGCLHTPDANLTSKAKAPRVSSSASNPVSTASNTEAALPANAGLESLVDHAMSHNPNIQSAEAHVRRLEAKVPQARSLPDPKLKVSAGSMAETAAGRVDWMSGVEQALPFPGKRRADAEAAEREASTAAHALATLKLEIAARVRKAYWKLYLAHETARITAENLKALALIQQSVDARVAANRGTQEDQLRLASEAGRQQQFLTEAEQALASTRALLNALLDRPGKAPLPIPSTNEVQTLSREHSRLTDAAASHPSIQRAQAKHQAAQSRLRRAHLDRYPDFVLGLQHTAVSNSGLAPSANGRDQFFASLGIQLPLWQAPRQARIDEAHAEMDGAQAEVRTARTTLQYQIEDASFRAQSAQSLIALFERQILPEAQQAFDSVLASYAAGNQSFVDALDAWRQLLAFQIQQAANQAQLGQAVADLQFASAR